MEKFLGLSLALGLSAGMTATAQERGVLRCRQQMLFRLCQAELNVTRSENGELDYRFKNIAGAHFCGLGASYEGQLSSQDENHFRGAGVNIYLHADKSAALVIEGRSLNDGYSFNFDPGRCELTE